MQQFPLISNFRQSCYLSVTISGFTISSANVEGSSTPDHLQHHSRQPQTHYGGLPKEEFKKSGWQNFVLQVRSKYRVMADDLVPFLRSGLEEHMSECCINKQESMFNLVVMDPLTRKYPIDQEQKKRFLKAWIAFIEDKSAEVYEELLWEYMQLLTVPSQDRYHRCYELGDYGVAPLRMAKQRYEDLGLVMWDAAFLLCEFIIANPHCFANRTCLELGAGVGLTGVALARMRPLQLVMTDHSSKTLENLHYNIGLNDIAVSPFKGIAKRNAHREEQNAQVGASVHIEELEWSKAAADPSTAKAFKADIIVASDVVYSKKAIDSVVPLLERLLNPADSCTAPIAYVSLTVRDRAKQSYFERKLTGAGITFTDITKSSTFTRLFDYDRNPLHLFLLRSGC